jgi:heat shock protein HtpX
MTTTNYLKTTLLLGALTGLILVCGALIGGTPGVLIALVLAAVFNLGAYWFSDKIVLASHRARRVAESDAPRLHAMLDGLCARAELPKPELYIVPEKAPSAFATGRNPEHSAVAVTAGLLETMNQKETLGVMAHELAHVKNRDILGLMTTAIFAPIAALGIQIVVARSREYAADATGAQIAGSPHGLASALEKLGHYGLFSTHPPAEERIRRLLGR